MQAAETEAQTKVLNEMHTTEKSSIFSQYTKTTTPTAALHQNKAAILRSQPGPGKCSCGLGAPLESRATAVRQPLKSVGK